MLIKHKAKEEIIKEWWPAVSILKKVLLPEKVAGYRNTEKWFKSLGENAYTLGCPEKQQVAQNTPVSYMWVNIYLKRHQKKFGEFSGIFEERPPIFVFTPIFWKNTPVIRLPTIFLTYTFKIFGFIPEDNIPQVRVERHPTR